MTAIQTIKPTVPANLADVTDEQIANMTDAEFASYMGQLLRVTAELIALAGRAYRARVEAGKPMPPLVGIWATYLPLIAAGSVLPETVANLWHKTGVLKAVAALPPDRQRRLMATDDPEKVAVCERNPKTGDVTFAMYTVADLTPAQAKLVFGDRCVRSEAEQRAIITSAVTKPKPLPKVIRTERFKILRESNEVVVGRSRVDAVELANALIEAGYAAPR